MKHLLLLPFNVVWRDWEEDERKGNDLVTNKEIIPNHGNTAGRLLKGSLLRRIQFSNHRKPESEASGLNIFQRKYCRELKNKKTYQKKASATGRVMN